MVLLKSRARIEGPWGVVARLWACGLVRGCGIGRMCGEVVVVGPLLRTAEDAERGGGIVRRCGMVESLSA